MKDREKIKLCAEAMKLDVYWGTPGLNTCPLLLDGGGLYDPRHDEEQAMALEDWLLERGELFLSNGYGKFTYHGAIFHSREWKDREGRRRFLVECVAKMQAAKK